MSQPNDLSTDELARILGDPSLPAPVRRALEGGATLERIELDAEGEWRHAGELFQNPNLIGLFHRSIGRTAGGTYVLSIPPFTYPILVADTPRFVRHVRIERGPGTGGVTLLLSDGSEEVLDPSTLAYVQDRGLYCRVGAERWLARFLRPAYYAIAELLNEGGDGYYLELPSGRASVPMVERASLGA